MISSVDTRISEFESHGKKFVIEPPIEPGNHVIDSLGMLAAVAWQGAAVDAEVINKVAQETNRILEVSFRSNGTDGFSQYLTNVASNGLKKYAVFTSKY